VSDLLPAVSEIYTIGSESKAWLRGIFKSSYQNDYTVLSKIMIGSKVVSTHPFKGNAVIPHIYFYQEYPIGTKQKSWLISTDNSSLFFEVADETVPDAKTILSFDPADWNNPFVNFEGHFYPLSDGTWDSGSPLGAFYTNRWRDIGMAGWLSLGNIQIRYWESPAYPDPSETYRLKAIGSTPDVGAGRDEYKICRKLSDDTYQYKDILDSFQSVAVLKSVNGKQKTNIGTTAVEILGAGHRSKVDLTNFDQCRVVFGGLNNEASAFRCKIQYSLNQTTWSDLTPEASGSGTSEQLVVGSWGSIPADALTDVFIRAVGRAATTTADPSYKSIEVQVR